EDMRVLDGELGWRVAIASEQLAGDGDAHAEALDETERLQRLGDRRVSVVGNPGRSERLAGHLAVRPARVLDLDLIRDPRDAYRRRRALVGPMEHRVPDQLSKCLFGIVGSLLAQRAA